MATKFPSFTVWFNAQQDRQDELGKLIRVLENALREYQAAKDEWKAAYHAAKDEWKAAQSAQQNIGAE